MVADAGRGFALRSLNRASCLRRNRFSAMRTARDKKCNRTNLINSEFTVNTLSLRSRRSDRVFAEHNQAARFPEPYPIDLSYQYQPVSNLTSPILRLYTKRLSFRLASDPITESADPAESWIAERNL